jgi:hypothetical protein
MIVGLVVVATGITATLLTQRAGGERWQRHEQAAFSLEAPASWRVAESEGRVTLTGEGSQGAVIWPFFVQRQLDDGSAGFVARSLAEKAAPEVNWSEAPARTSGVAQLVGSSPGLRAAAMLVYSPSRAGTAGNLYVTVAPEDEFADATSTFARVLGSFEARGVPVAKQRAERLVSWTDPAEGAFSAKVPAGWTTTGGTERPSSLLVQATINTRSPDSKVSAVMTDALPLYVEPNQLLEFAGIYEGGTYVDPSGYSSPVRHYAAGERYVTDYIVPAHVPGATVTHAKARPDLARRLATYGISSYDVGEVEYRFSRGGIPYTGGALCITEKVSAGSYVAWHVWRLFLTEAPSNRYREGVSALDNLAASFHIDPDWAARQAETTRQQSGIIARMSNDVSETLSNGYWARQQVYDALSDRRSRATLEVEDLTDENGNSYRVDSGSSYYWIDPSGTIVGTDTSSRPDVDFSELVGVDD